MLNCESTDVKEDMQIVSVKSAISTI